MDLLALRATLGLDSKDYDSGLERARSNAVSVGGAIASGLKIGVAAIGAAATAVGFLVKKSVDSYSEFQQLEGGVKKLYGSAASEVMKNAQEAYKTAGMSANQYMEQATSFSAALIGSLNGDVQKAAKQTDVAMRAISDNVNTFGSDMGSVQYAFQGFAKQNYTMLDNLKLGYGGTKTEMERLIDDANEYAESIGLASDLSIESFSDIVTAIDLIQQKQGIAKTTAAEAASTISGSIGSMKAAWENLLTGMSDPDADMGKLIDNMVETATTSISNLVPTIERALNGVATLIENLAPVISDKLPSLISQILPKLISAGISLIAGVVSALPEIISALISAIPTVVTAIAKALSASLPSAMGEIKKTGSSLLSGLLDGLRNGIPKLVPFAKDAIVTLTEGLINSLDDVVDVAVDIMIALADGLRQALPELIPVAMNALMKFSGSLRENAGEIVDAGLNLIMTLAQALVDNLPVFIETIPTIISNIAGIINDNAPKLIIAGVQLITMLVQGIINSVPILIAEFPEIIQAIVDAWSAFNWLQLGTDLINSITNGIKNLINEIPNALKNIGETAWKNIRNVDWVGVGRTIIQFIINGIRALFTNIPNVLRSIGSNGMSAFRSINWASVGRAAVSFIASGIRGLGSSIGSALSSVGRSAMSAFRNINWSSLGSNIISGIVAGLSWAGGSLYNALRSLASDALSAAKSALKIGSPSKLFRDEVGKWIPAGIAEGVDLSASMVDDAVSSLADPSDFDLSEYEYEVDEANSGSKDKNGYDYDDERTMDDAGLLEKIDRLIDLLEYYLPKRNYPNGKELDRMLGALV